MHHLQAPSKLVIQLFSRALSWLVERTVLQNLPGCIRPPWSLGCFYVFSKAKYAKYAKYSKFWKYAKKMQNLRQSGQISNTRQMYKSCSRIAKYLSCLHSVLQVQVFFFSFMCFAALKKSIFEGFELVVLNLEIFLYKDAVCGVCNKYEVCFTPKETP